MAIIIIGSLDWESRRNDCFDYIPVQPQHQQPMLLTPRRPPI